MKSNKILIFLTGLISGILISLILNLINLQEREYLKLKKDYCIKDIGVIKSGTILRFDEAFSEGFSRYVLYINIHDSEDLEKYETEEMDLIIPYWLREMDTTCTN